MDFREEVHYRYILKRVLNSTGTQFIILRSIKQNILLKKKELKSWRSWETHSNMYITIILSIHAVTIILPATLMTGINKLADFYTCSSFK